MVRDLFLSEGSWPRLGLFWKRKLCYLCILSVINSFGEVCESGGGGVKSKTMDEILYLIISEARKRCKAQLSAIS
jgi:hypothetical protein